jgi:hypothetical protein
MALDIQTGKNMAVYLQYTGERKTKEVKINFFPSVLILLRQEPWHSEVSHR